MSRATTQTSLRTGRLTTGQTGRLTTVALACGGFAAAATIAVGVPGVAASAGAGQAARGGHTETYQVPFASFHHAFVGADEKHPAVGDRSFDSGKLTAGGHVVGTLYNTCTVVRDAKPVTAQCVGSLLLPHGQLQLLVSTGNGHGPTTVLAMAGGTGRYAGATGTVVTTPGRKAITVALHY